MHSIVLQQQSRPRPSRAAKTRANTLLHYAANDPSDSSDESICGEAVDGSEQVEEDKEVPPNGEDEEYPDDDTFDTDLLFEMTEEGDASDYDDDFADVPPLRERLGLAARDSDDDSADVPPPRQSLGLTSAQLTSLSGLSWSANSPPANGRQHSSNICREGLFQVKVEARLDSERELLLLFISVLIQEAVFYTNLYGKRAVRNWNMTHSEKRHWKPVDVVEMEAFIGLHILAGAFKGQYRSTEDLWSERDGQPAFRATMSRERFCALKSAMRFDDPLRRNRDDPLAPIRYVFESFTCKLRRYVVAGPFLTVDEQLVEFHGRVHFRQYIPSKPGKFGMKIFWVCDAENAYCLNGLVYIGKDTVSADTMSENSNSLPESVVMQLCAPFLKKGRNITADNWFTSLPLVQRLRNESTTYVGTVRANRRDIPSIAKETKGAKRTRGDTRHYHSNNVVLCSFWDKGSKPVLLLDSFSKAPPTPPVGTKPDTVMFYNRTKSGVDVMDHLCRMFSAKRKCRRWPYSLAMNLVDVAGVNASIICRHLSASNKRESSHVHHKFLKSAGYQLIDAQIQRRLATEHLRGPAMKAVQLLGYRMEVIESSAENHLLVKQARCSLCPRLKDRKVTVCCVSCRRPMCTEHRAFLCVNCGHL